MTRRLTTDEFIKKSKTIHNDEYDYTKVVYRNNFSKVTIVCGVHGEFEQAPKDHMRGIGCDQCSHQPKGNEKFIEESEVIHNGKYGYSKVDYKNKKIPVVITCPIHGDFQQIPTVHKRGSGCPKCGKVARISNDVFIIRSSIKHGFKYSYFMTDYKKMTDKVLIICPHHGLFSQVAYDHVRGAGCQACSISGFKYNQPGVLYILCDDVLSPTLIKIGISNDLTCRVDDLKRATPFPVSVLMSYEFETGADAYQIEQSFHNSFKKFNAGLTGFDGCTEWFRYDPVILDCARLLLGKSK